MDYNYFMKKALGEAQAALVAGEFPVGCVMVHDQKILVSGARKGTTGDCPNDYLPYLVENEVPIGV